MFSKATVSDSGRAVSTIVSSFVGDPAVRWLYPEPDAFLRHFPRMVEHFGGRAFEHGCAYQAEGFAGVAMWLPPDVHPDGEKLDALFGETLTEVQLALLGPAFEQMEHYHPDEPCWHLAFIGVDPPRQRQGLGSKILEHGLEWCARDGLPAYLEATSLLNKAFYERHGFAAIGIIQSGSAPPLWPMLYRSA